MAEDGTTHGPGIRQRKMMATTGKGYPESSFGIKPWPPGGVVEHPDSNMDTGKTMSDGERAAGFPVKVAQDKMPASRQPDHGPHDHKMGRG